MERDTGSEKPEDTKVIELNEKDWDRLDREWQAVVDFKPGIEEKGHVRGHLIGQVNRTISVFGLKTMLGMNPKGEMVEKSGWKVSIEVEKGAKADGTQGVVKAIVKGKKPQIR